MTGISTSGAFAAATLLLAGSMAAYTSESSAQVAAYPSRSIRLIVPTPPGGGADIASRVIGRKLSENLAQPVVIENRAGAAGNVAAEQVAKMPPDGYTIFMGAIAPLAISPSLYRSLPYDSLRDFAPVTMAVTFSNVLVAHPSVPAKTIQELIALAKAKPGSLNFGSSGNATIGHLAGELLSAAAGIHLVHVPYKGGGPAMADLLSGQIQLIFASPPTALPHIRTGKLRALAVTTLSRIAGLPQVPTLAESVAPGFEANNWYCFVAPARTPPEIVARLNRELRRAMIDPEVRDVLLVQGMEPSPSTPEELAAFMKSEIAKWGKVVRERNIAPD